MILFVQLLGKSNNGYNSAYSLIDKIFERIFLVQFTWTGISRRGLKKPFNVYKNMIDIFFETVNSVDNQFSYDDTVKFLKNKILKYASQRAKSLKKRLSTTRHVIIRNKKKEISNMIDPTEI